MDDVSTNFKGKLSVIIPVYNEAAVIEDVIRDFYKKVATRILDVKLIIAEDGSTDGTKEILYGIKKEIPFILISGSERKGYTRAFKDALSAAGTELVFFSDSDAQHDSGDIFKLLEKIDENDVVSGYKSPRRDSFHRILLSKTYNFLIYLLFGLKMKDIDSGFKLIRKKVIETILPDVVILKHCVMSEFIIKAYLAGYKIKEVPVKHYPRRHGRTAIFTLQKLPGIICGLIGGLLKIKFSCLKKKK